MYSIKSGGLVRPPTSKRAQQQLGQNWYRSQLMTMAEANLFNALCCKYAALLKQKLHTEFMLLHTTAGKSRLFDLKISSPLKLEL